MGEIYNPLFFKYLLACTWPNCNGRAEVDQAMSAGWTLGYMVPEDPTHPEIGKCPRCRRYKMKVVRVPDPPVPVKPAGWNKIPTS